MHNLRRKSITDTFLIISVLITLVVVVFIGGSNIFSLYHTYEKDITIYEKEYLDRQKQSLQVDVEQTQLAIKNSVNNVEARLKKDIRNRVYEAYDIANNLSKKFNEKMSQGEVVNLIREALRPIRFYSGRGYFFAFNTKGVEILFADRPELEGKNLYNSKSSDGKYVVREMVDIALKEGEGYIKYNWTKPNAKGDNFPKIAFVRYIKSLDLVIGTGEYLDDVIVDAQKELLKSIEEKVTKSLDYIWVVSYDGTLLAHPFLPDLIGKPTFHITDPAGNKISQMAVDTAKNGGGYIDYAWVRPGKKHPSSKVAYVQPYADWNWAIVTGAYMDDLDLWVKNKKDQLLSRLIDQILITMFVMGLAFVMSTIVFKKTTSKISEGFQFFQDLFENPDKKISKQQEQDFQFAEFQLLSKSAKTVEKYCKQISEEKEKAQTALKTRTEFLNNMSHEIRTPMNVIIGMADLLDESKMNDEQRMFLGSFQDACKSLLTIINDILDLSKLEAGKLELDFAYFDIELKLQKIVQLFKNEANKKMIDLSYDIDKDIAAQIKTDEIRLSQIISNLVGNSLKFTEKGNVKIKLKLLEDHANSQLLQFEVYDTGIGISQDNLKNIFEEFNQGDASITKRFGGTGLGLSISGKLVRLLGGRLKVESTEGEYTRFFFNLDLPVDKNSTLVNTADKKDQTGVFDFSGKHFDKFKILAIDDTPENLVLIKKFLKHPDIELTTVTSGIDGITEFQNNTFDLIFMDVQMPEMDGYETTKKIREIEVKNSRPRTPIYALTAYAMQENIQRSLAAGCDGHLTKPIRKIELQKFVFQMNDKTKMSA